MAAPVKSNQAFAGLWTQSNTVQVSRANNTDAGVRRLAAAYRHIHGENSQGNAVGTGTADTGGVTFAARCGSFGISTSDYRNGSYVSQANTTQLNFGEAGLLETQAPLAISTIWPGNWTGNVTGGYLLEAAITGTQTSNIRFTVAANRPAGAHIPAYWPIVFGHYFNGTSWVQSAARVKTAFSGTTTTSDSTALYVAWVRIDDEVMALLAAPTVSGGVITLPSVRRGMWGTGAASHNASVRVFTPVYISPTATSDGGLAGRPTRQDAYQLRYAVKIWQGSEAVNPSGTIKALGHGWDWIGDQLEREMNNTAATDG
jgi:hypothetical protein